MRGGSTDTCNKGDITIEEDQLKIASPEEAICYGDTITSCTTVTIVMENDWKIGVHINPFSSLGLDDSIPAQKYTPGNILDEIMNEMSKNKNFSGTIKKIYVIGDSGKYVVYQNKNMYKSRLNNQNSILASPFSPGINLKAISRDFFKSHFGKKVTDTTQIVVNPEVTIQSKKNHHFFVLKDGTLDIISG